MEYVWIGVLLALTYIYTFICGFSGGNVIATLLASHAMKQNAALYLAAAVEFVAPVFFGGAVAKSIGNDIILAQVYQNAPRQEAWIFLCSGLAGCVLFKLIAWITKLPVSSSHALIGGLLGAGIAAFGFGAANWNSLLFKIILAMFLAPILAFIIGFIIMKIIRTIAERVSDRADVVFTYMQRANTVVLAAMQSANESQKSVGIVLLIFLVSGRPFGHVPFYVTLMSSGMLALGVLIGGLRIVRTVGLGLYRVRPVHSLSSQLASSIVLCGSTAVGSPVSPSQIVSSSIVGVGTAFRMNAVRWGAAAKIASTWFTTIPVSAVFGAGIYMLMDLIL